MSAAIARYLKDFGDPQPSHHQPVLQDFSAEDSFHTDAVSLDQPFEEPEVDVDAVRQEAYAEGYETASVELGARHADEMSALQASHAAALQELREHYEMQAAQAIASGLRSIAETLSERISEEAATCLAPVLQEEIARQSVATLASLVREAVTDGYAGTIIVKGPLSLFNILATEMGDDRVLLRHADAPDLDLTVELADSVLVTRMSAFAASLKKVLE